MKSPDNEANTSILNNGNIVSSLEIKVRSFDLFNLSSCVYIDCMKVYYAYFEVIPSFTVIRGVKHEQAIKYIESEFSEQIVKKHHQGYYSRKKRKMKSENVIYILKDGLLVDIEDTGAICILFTNDLEDKANAIVNKMKRFVLRTKKTTEISILINDSYLKLVDIENKKPKLILKENYNDDLLILHEHIVKKLKKKNESGIILFHGTPGTGKSTYLRYLIHCLNKKVIFLSPKIAGKLDSPDLMKILSENQNSILIIEDAEDLLASRETGNNSGISLLLNLTDGLLGESLGIQVICTFNTHVTNIDKALLRKGRLTALYEFKALSILKSTALLKKIGNGNYPVSDPMTLADIYNSCEQHFEFNMKKQNAIGFKTIAEFS